MKKKLKPLSPKDYPQGLDREEREEWHRLCYRLFQLYKQMPMGETKTKMIAGSDEFDGENWLLFFKGDLEDLVKIRDILQ